MSKSDKDIVIVSAVRTAIGKFGGSLSSFSASELGAKVIEEVLKRAQLKPEQVDEVILGNVLQAGQGQNPARQATLKAGLPNRVLATSINIVCGSGLKSVALAAQTIQTGDAEVVVCGGMENMSQAPYVIDKARWGLKMGDQTLVDVMVKDGLWCAKGDTHMGITAENVAEKYGVTREKQDAFAGESQLRAEKAITSGAFKDEIMPFSIPQRKADPIIFDTDEFPRFGTTAEKLSKLKPAFKKDGTVTAGNASGINDGAAVFVLMTRKKQEMLGIPVLATLKGHAAVGIDPDIMGVAPINAIKKVLEKTGLSKDDIDLFECNEAFASQSVAVANGLELDAAKVNVNGGAIALGHPIGASGARILVTLLYAMKNRDAKIGCAALCVGGGMGVSVVVERD